MATIVKHGLKNADDIIKKSDEKTKQKNKGGTVDGNNDPIKNMSSNVDGGHKVNFQKLADSYELFLDYTYTTPRGKCKKLSIKNPFATKTKNMKIDTLKTLAESMQKFITYCKEKIDATEDLLNSYKNLYKLNHVSKITQEKAENTIEKAKNAAAEAAKFATSELTKARESYKEKNTNIGKLEVYNLDSFKNSLNLIIDQLGEKSHVS